MKINTIFVAQNTNENWFGNEEPIINFNSKIIHGLTSFKELASKSLTSEFFNEENVLQFLVNGDADVESNFGVQNFDDINLSLIKEFAECGDILALSAIINGIQTEEIIITQYQIEEGKK